jgi:hypothetical protein
VNFNEKIAASVFAAPGRISFVKCLNFYGSHTRNKRAEHSCGRLVFTSLKEARIKNQEIETDKKLC